MATHFAGMMPGYFSAMCMLAPYFTLVSEEMLSKYRPWIKLLDLLVPSQKLIPFPVRNGR